MATLKNNFENKDHLFDPVAYLKQYCPFSSAQTINEMISNFGFIQVYALPYSYSTSGDPTSN